MRSINLIFLVILLAVMTLLGGVMHLVHGVQLRQHATALQERAEREAASNDLEKAEQSLKQYLSVRREDVPAWKRNAQIVDERDPGHQRRDRVFLVYDQALQYNAGDSELERQRADLALEIGAGFMSTGLPAARFSFRLSDRDRIPLTRLLEVDCSIPTLVRPRIG